jgi:hypothetical protein
MSTGAMWYAEPYKSCLLSSFLSFRLPPDPRHSPNPVTVNGSYGWFQEAFHWIPNMKTNLPILRSRLFSFFTFFFTFLFLSVIWETAPLPQVKLQLRGLNPPKPKLTTDRPSCRVRFRLWNTLCPSSPHLKLVSISDLKIGDHFLNPCRIHMVRGVAHQHRTHRHTVTST